MYLAPRISPAEEGPVAAQPPATREPASTEPAPTDGLFHVDADRLYDLSYETDPALVAFAKEAVRPRLVSSRCTSLRPGGRKSLQRLVQSRSPRAMSRY